MIGFADPSHFKRFLEINRPEIYLENPMTVIVLGIHLFDIFLDVWTENSEKGVGYQFADQILTNLCHKIKDFLSELGHASRVIPYRPGLYLKDAAVLAGIGPIGKNNLLITQEYGPQVRLRAIVTNAPLINANPVIDNPFCDKCEKCIDACPVNALSNGEYDKNKCYNYQLSNLKKISNFTSLWCNLCIEACPVCKK